MNIEFAYCLDADRGVALPAKQSANAAGYDVRANLKPQDRTAGLRLEAGNFLEISSGISIAMPDDVQCEVRSRSGLAKSAGVVVLNSPGTIDPDFRGEISVLLANFGKLPMVVSHGMRIAQLVFISFVSPELIEVETLPPSERSTDGFGSTGTN